MVDLTRLRQILVILGLLLVSLIGANVVLTVVSAAFPGWLPHQFFGVDFIADNRQRAVAAAARVRTGAVDEKEIVLVLGLSSASEGIELAALDARAGGTTRVLGLCGAGRNMQEVALYAEPLLESGVRPGRVVFAISPFHLMDPPPFREGFWNNLRQRQTLVELLGFWLPLRRGDVKHVVEVAVLEARARLWDALGVRVEESGADPWREIVRMGLHQARTEEEWSAKVEQYGLRGYYDPASYARSHAQAETLVTLIRRFRERGADVEIVLMPEHSSLRERVPPEALATLYAALAQAFGERAPPVIDLRDASPDGDFTDISHLNADGRRALGPVLAAALGLEGRR